MRRRLSLATLLAVGATSAQAVSLDAGGLGQALIYPYYTVRSVGGNAFNTYLSVANTTDSSKVLRVRLREGRAGQQAIGFNLYLGPRDMWTAAVVPDGSGVKLLTRDRSCTNPAFGAAANGVAEAALGASIVEDGLGPGAERITEGYAEVIEMATLTGAAANAVRPTPTGVPFNCAAVQGSSVDLAGQLEAPTGGLAGTLTLINVNNGRDYTVNADALADLADRAYYRDYGSREPDFDSAEVTRTSALLAEGKSYRLSWSTGLEAVDSVLMAEEIHNELVFDRNTASGTQWIATLPTRRLHMTGGAPSAPFAASRFPGCREVALGSSSREGDRTVSLYPNDPAPPLVPLYNFARACYAANVATFVHRSLSTPPQMTDLPEELGSANRFRGDPLPVRSDVDNGAGRLRFYVPSTDPRPSPGEGLVSQWGSTSRDLATGQTATGRFHVMGIPVTGMMVRSFTVGATDCGGRTCASTFGGAFPHTRVRRVLVAP
jgi:hypothetical protein